MFCNHLILLLAINLDYFDLPRGALNFIVVTSIQELPRQIVDVFGLLLDSVVEIVTFAINLFVLHSLLSSKFLLLPSGLLYRTGHSLSLVHFVHLHGDAFDHTGFTVTLVSLVTGPSRFL